MVAVYLKLRPHYFNNINEINYISFYIICQIAQKITLKKYARYINNENINKFYLNKRQFVVKIIVNFERSLKTYAKKRRKYLQT